MKADGIAYFIGLDISTQSVTALLAGVNTSGGAPREIVLHEDWRCSRPWASEEDRKRPEVWVQLTRNVILELIGRCPEARQARAIGVSTAFPGVFAVLPGGRIDPRWVSLYDNLEDAGVCSGALEELLAQAEDETLNRMWPGNMAIGLVSLVKCAELRLEQVAALMPPNTAFSHALLACAGVDFDLRELRTDFTQAVISGLYDAMTASPVPEKVAGLLRHCLPGLDVVRLREMLPKAAPSWQNSVPAARVARVADLLSLPDLTAVSVGAGDSPLGALALGASEETILNVRGSSDSPVLAVRMPRPRHTRRETVLHYPLPTAASLTDSAWCVVAPMLRSGRVWDWVKRLRFPDASSEHDLELERLAVNALKRRLRCDVPLLSFDTALGGERAPDWDADSTGRIQGLVEDHGIGDIALAALEGVSLRLRACVSQMESRYELRLPRMVLAGGPTKNNLWSWMTGLFLGKDTYRTEFVDASALGAAMLGYGAWVCATIPDGDAKASRCMCALAELAQQHPAVWSIPVAAPDSELAELEPMYRRQIAALCGEV
jgi:sugar (pentulose or hexulose) kinase